jgi:hypothetical protein
VLMIAKGKPELSEFVAKIEAHLAEDELDVEAACNTMVEFIKEHESNE